MAVGSWYILAFGRETPSAVLLAGIRRILGPLAHYAVALVPRFYLHAVCHVQLEEKMVFNAVAEGLRGIFRRHGYHGDWWHGITPSYILYGLYHGLLLAATETYQKKSKFYKKHKNKTWYQVCLMGCNDAARILRILPCFQGS